MNFKTQVCTTLEQSGRLLALGLKKETADMFYYLDDHYGPTAYVLYADLPNGWDDDYVPAWSLHRLMELCPQAIHLDDYADTHYRLTVNPLKVIYIRDDKQWLKQCDEGNTYDRMIDMIEWLIKNNYFNREYLEETK